MGQDADAGQVVPGVLLLAVEAGYVGALPVHHRQHVELEVADVVDGRLVVDEELAQKGQVRAVDPVGIIVYINLGNYI